MLKFDKEVITETRLFVTIKDQKFTAYEIDKYLNELEDTQNWGEMLGYMPDDLEKVFKDLGVIDTCTNGGIFRGENYETFRKDFEKEYHKMVVEVKRENRVKEHIESKENLKTI